MSPSLTPVPTSGADFASMASQYSPTSSMYQMLMGLANNPSAAQNSNINAEISSAIQGPVMPGVTGTLPNGQTGTIPYNVAAPANMTDIQLTGSGSPGWLANAPGGSAATIATPVTNPATQWQPPAPPQQLNTLAPGSPDQPSTVIPGLSGNPISNDPSNPGFADLGRRAGTGIGAQNNPISSLPINLGGLNLGSLSTSAMLPALISSLSGLWGYLGSSAKYDAAGNLINTAETNAGNQVAQTAGQAASNIQGTAQNAAAGVTNATGTANNTLGNLYNTSTGALSPYSTAGATGANGLTSGLQPGGDLNQTLTPDQILQQNPGYQFMLGEGERGIQNQLAAEGLGDSGAAGKAISDYQQNMAANAYQQAFQNQQTQEQNLFGRLYNTAGLGTTATGQGITAGEAFGAPQAANDISSSIYGGNAAQTAAENAGGFNLTGSQYQGNANVTGAGAQAGAKIDEAQQQQAFIQQLTTALLSLFQNQNGNGASSNPLALSTNDAGTLINTLLGGGSSAPSRYVAA